MIMAQNNGSEILGIVLSFTSCEGLIGLDIVYNRLQYSGASTIVYL